MMRVMVWCNDYRRKSRNCPFSIDVRRSQAACPLGDWSGGLDLEPDARFAGVAVRDFGYPHRLCPTRVRPSDHGRDWREWFIGRVESWRPTSLCAALQRRMMSGDNFREWERLPHGWIAARPWSSGSAGGSRGGEGKGSGLTRPLTRRLPESLQSTR